MAVAVSHLGVAPELPTKGGGGGSGTVGGGFGLTRKGQGRGSSPQKEALTPHTRLSTGHAQRAPPPMPGARGGKDRHAHTQEENT